MERCLTGLGIRLVHEAKDHVFVVPVMLRQLTPKATEVIERHARGADKVAVPLVVVVRIEENIDFLGRDVLDNRVKAQEFVAIAMR